MSCLRRSWLILLVMFLFCACAPITIAQNTTYPSDVISVEKWKQVDASIERALSWIASQQNRDGSFPTIPTADPAVSSLAVMAFLAAGHDPDSPEYGDNIKSTIEYVLATQRDDGLFSKVKPVAPVTNWHGATHTAMYNHAIAGLMLCECYGMTASQDIKELTTAIERALAVTYREQRRPGPYKVDDGGWRYLEYVNWDHKSEADLSVTGWHLMFLRSAANAGFDVPEQRIKASAGYVRRCFDEEMGTFRYGILPHDHTYGRGMAGAGILSMAMAGEHHTKIAKQAGEYILKRPVNQYNRPDLPKRGEPRSSDRFHYGVHYASHGMYQLGGRYWREFYPTLVDTMLAGQTPSGSWQPETPSGADFGRVYTTALAVLSLTPPYQILPIYQR